jgi:hypothetical protein
MEFVERISNSVHALLYAYWTGNFPKDQCIQELKRLRSGFFFKKKNDNRLLIFGLGIFRFVQKFHVLGSRSETVKALFEQYFEKLEKMTEVNCFHYVSQM